MAPETLSIEFQDVQVDYPRHKTALRNFSLKIARGEFVFFLGPSGAGKSTVLKLLTRETRQTSGRVLLNGRDLQRVRDWEIPGLRRQMGIVPQDFALLPRKTVWENVAYAMRALGHSRREVRRRVSEILEQVGIGQLVDAFPDEVSGGEKQRVAIARALVNNPPLLIADEPTGNLDFAHSMEIMEILKRLNIRGTTVLVASHDVMSVHQMAKRIVTLEKGCILSDIPGGSGA